MDTLAGKSEKEQREILKRVLARRLVAAGYRRGKGSRFEREGENLSVRATIQKPLYTADVGLWYSIRWTGEEIAEIDPEAASHLISDFGRPAGDWRRAWPALRNFDSEPEMPEAVRVSEMDRAIAADWHAIVALVRDREEFRRVFLHSTDEDRKRFLMFGPARRGRVECPKRNPGEGPDIEIIELPE